MDSLITLTRKLIRQTKANAPSVKPAYLYHPFLHILNGIANLQKYEKAPQGRSVQLEQVLEG